MRITFKKILSVSLLFLTAFFITSPLSADELDDLNKKIQEYEQKINDLQGEQRTLSSAIVYLDSKIKLTTTKILATEQELKMLGEEISKLSVKIGILDVSLTDVSEILSSRIQETYKRSLIDPVFFIFSSKGFGDAISRLQYLRVVQRHDRDLLFQMQESKMNYGVQKDLKEEKQEKEEELKGQLLSHQVVLDQQKLSKQELLNVTKNDEKEYQGLLAVARAEMEAIQSIMAGYGAETEVGGVNEGNRIASIISGTSACSTGTHLHFEVVVNGSNVDPAGKLKSKDVVWDICGWWPDCDSTFSFTGSWNWPINGTPRITQGYGMTGYARTGAYGGGPHTGLDMVSGDLVIKAVKNGTLSRGSIGCGGGTLRYVKVDHNDSDIDTFYLHVNY